MDNLNDVRQEVREFLTTRRARITPEQAGLPVTGNRRVPGLRRSEVAALAGLSVEYYARLERGQIVLEIIDGSHRIGRRRPGEMCLRRKFAQFRDASRHRPDHIERIKRSDARAPRRGIEPRIRNIQRLFSCADSHVQAEPLLGRTVVVRRQIGREIAAGRVEQERIFINTRRKHTLDEPRHEDDFERTARSLLDRRNEDASVAPLRRAHFECAEPLGQRDAHFIDPHGRDFRHWLELGQHLENAIGPPQRRGGEIAQRIDPVAPAPAVLQLIEAPHDRQREVAKVCKPVELALDDVDARRFRLFAADFREAAPELRIEPTQAPIPPRFPSDDRRLDEQLLPPVRLHVSGLGARASGLGFFLIKEILGGAPGLACDLTRYLPQRQVLSESFRRKPLRSACQQREQGRRRRSHE